MDARAMLMLCALLSACLADAPSGPADPPDEPAHPTPAEPPGPPLLTFRYRADNGESLHGQTTGVAWRLDQHAVPTPVLVIEYTFRYPGMRPDLMLLFEETVDRDGRVVQQVAMCGFMTTEAGEDARCQGNRSTVFMGAAGRPSLFAAHWESASCDSTYVEPTAGPLRGLPWTAAGDIRTCPGVPLPDRFAPAFDVPRVFANQPRTPAASYVLEAWNTTAHLARWPEGPGNAVTDLARARTTQAPHLTQHGARLLFPPLEAHQEAQRLSTAYQEIMTSPDARLVEYRHFRSGGLEAGALTEHRAEVWLVAHATAGTRRVELEKSVKVVAGQEVVDHALLADTQAVVDQPRFEPRQAPLGQALRAADNLTDLDDRWELASFSHAPDAALAAWSLGQEAKLHAATAVLVASYGDPEDPEAAFFRPYDVVFSAADGGLLQIDVHHDQLPLGSPP